MLNRGLLAICLGVALTLSAQAPENTTPQVEPMEKTPTFRVNVLQRSTSAVNYAHRQGTTKIDFRGTTLLPDGRGQAKVEGKAGRIEINAEFDRLLPARNYGSEYLTYVLWAITPEGRSLNLGEVLLDKDRARTRVTTDLQAFGMIVTAEPYFAVTRPSNMVVLENIVRRDTKGWEQPITARFDVLEKGEYTIDVKAASLPATYADPRTPLELLQARNAVAIAKAAGADRYASEALTKAQEFLARGEDYYRRKESRASIATVARGAAQAAEDARILTIRKQREERLAAERRAAEERTEEARATAAEEAERRRLAETERTTAEQARLEADRARAEAEAAAERARQERAAADQARQTALDQQQQLQAQAQQAEQARLQAEQEREVVRARLQQQLNQVLQTRDTARGLIVNMSDVLFDTGKATLKPGARERLARVAGIIMAYPDLRLAIEGHTDNVGGDAYNMTLSERRADTVRQYLISQGVPAQNISAQGFGKAQPIASNATPSGRQLNRRVDLVVSGEAIATQAGPAFRVDGAGRTGAAAGATRGAPNVTSGVGSGNTATIGVTGGASAGTTSQQVGTTGVGVQSQQAPATGQPVGAPASTTTAPVSAPTTNTTVPAQQPPSTTQQPQQQTPPPTSPQ